MERKSRRARARARAAAGQRGNQEKVASAESEKEETANAQNASPAQKAEHTRFSFERKVGLLEEWVEKGVPDGQSWPRTVKALAEWEDKALGLTAWRKPNIVSKSGTYADLRLRYDRAADALKSKAPVGRDLRAVNAKLKRQNVALAEQIVVLRAQINRIKKQVLRERSLKEQAINLERQTAEMRKIRPFRAEE